MHMGDSLRGRSFGNPKFCKRKFSFLYGFCHFPVFLLLKHTLNVVKLQVSWSVLVDKIFNFRYIKYKHEKSTTLDSKGCMTLKIKKLKNLTLVTRSSKNKNYKIPKEIYFFRKTPPEILFTYALDSYYFV